MARILKRKAKSICVPTLEQDAAERKRLLNVLAQRRYRERKRQHYEELESKTSSGSQSDTPSKTASPQDSVTDLFSEKNFSLEECGGAWDTSVLFPSLHSPANTSWVSISPPSSMTTDASSSAWNSTEHLDFPDEAYLPMLELNILKAGMMIAKRLNIEDSLWDLSAISPFNHTTDLNFGHLPVNLRPTYLQLTTPHHPILDMLPWPDVRDKMIIVFSQPESLRPPMARSPTALITFAYDMEDTSEGIRVTGDNPYASENWELGQTVFSKWWWAFTKEIIDHSNAMRKARGATTLKGMVVGEVA